MRDIISSIEAEYRRYKILAEGAFRQLRKTELSKSRSEGENSVAVIVWHISGNLKSRFSDFLTSDGEKSWRDRDSEFIPRPLLTSKEMIERWDGGWATLFNALDALDDSDLQRTVTIRRVEHRVHDVLLRMLAHTSYHVGQIIFIVKSFRGPEWKTLSIPLGQSEQYNLNPTREKPPES